MTGFASDTGAASGWSWLWDIRSVNARGLDIRLRIPDGLEGLDQAIRPAIQKAVARGNIQLSLKVHSEGAAVMGEVNPDALDRALSMIAEVEHAAQARSVSLTPANPADVLGLRGVIETDSSNDTTTALTDALKAAFPALLKAFVQSRVAEGKHLGAILTGQFDQIAALTEAAATEAEARRDQTAATLRDNLARVLENTQGADPDRVAQELAMLAVKADVTEELDRLRAHVATARQLLAARDAVGRKLDFLCQEFNREANTLCSKSQSADLTRIGLDLKATIEQMREQVQNVE